MTELEKIAYTKNFIDKLAGGINPLDGTPVAEGDLVKNVRISHCFQYVSEILGSIIENGGIGKAEKTKPFAITAEQLARVEFSQAPISASELAKRLSSAVGDPGMKALSAVSMNKWLVKAGLMYTDESAGKARRLPTPKGREMGISTAQKTGRDGEYTAVLYGEKMQRYIASNVSAITAE